METYLNLHMKFCSQCGLKKSNPAAGNITEAWPSNIAMCQNKQDFILVC